MRYHWRRQFSCYRRNDSSASIPISKKFLLRLNDGSRKHISREERDMLLLSGEAKKIGAMSYFSTVPVKTFHAMSDLSELLTEADPQNLRKYLAGKFIFEIAKKRYSEKMGTAGGEAPRFSQNPPVSA